MGTQRGKGRGAKPSDAGAAAVDPVEAARRAAFTTTDPAAAFAHFRAEAEAVPSEGLSTFKGRSEILRVNVTEALGVLEPVLGVAAARLKDPPIQSVLEIPALVLALGYAIGRVPATSLSDGEIKAYQTELLPLRADTLAYLEVAAGPGQRLVPEGRVRAIREGTGPLDAARDAVALSAVFEEFAESLSGKHPFRPEQIQRLAFLGATLQRTLTPRGAVTTAAERPKEAVLRDQLAELVRRRYNELELLATVALGPEAARAQIPALHRAVFREETPAAPAADDSSKPAPADAPAAG